ncbi:MAG: type II secretion system major pseudopilin GspG [Gammaproteobacteria bacterium]|nr:type II secretion system major pseudopilin GspG [Gammaproteobacteria bacterium]
MLLLEDARSRDATGGWTLLELMVVLAIIALIGALVGPALLTQTEGAKVKAADAQVKMLRGSLLTYRLDVGQFPSTAQGLAALNTAPQEVAEYWRGPYLDDDVPLDPWRKAYVYEFPAETRHGFALYSLGADSAPGGDDLNADIGVIPQAEAR